MPFIRIDEDIYEELASELDVDLADVAPAESRRAGPDGFHYEPADVSFKPEDLDPIARVTLTELANRGATTFRVRYDGGYDEGFAHPEYVAFGDSRRSAADVVDELNHPAFIASVRAAASPRRYNTYTEKSDALVARHALDELAHALASSVLGDGYGTGEYALYGAFIADLTNHQIMDDPSEPKPVNME